MIKRQLTVKLVIINMCWNESISIKNKSRLRKTCLILFMQTEEEPVIDLLKEVVFVVLLLVIPCAFMCE